MWVSIGLIVALLFIALFLKYVFGTSGPSPFDVDTREPLKPVQLDKKERNKVLKQGEHFVFVSGVEPHLFISVPRIAEINMHVMINMHEIKKCI